MSIVWRVEETEGAIGFVEYKTALDVALKLAPEGAKIMLIGDRFYGGPDLNAWCRRAGLGWPLRLEGELLVFDEGGQSTAAQYFRRGERMLRAVELTEWRVVTDIGLIREHGHPEPWFVAMSDTPSSARTLDYGLREGIEAMLPDCKAHGFGIQDS